MAGSKGCAVFRQAQNPGSPAWAGFYQRYLDRGLKSTQALTILAGKLARIAFAVLKNGTDYVPRHSCVAA